MSKSLRFKIVEESIFFEESVFFVNTDSVFYEESVFFVNTDSVFYEESVFFVNTDFVFYEESVCIRLRNPYSFVCIYLVKHLLRFLCLRTAAAVSFRGILQWTCTRWLCRSSRASQFVLKMQPVQSPYILYLQTPVCVLIPKNEEKYYNVSWFSFSIICM
jgi:hypothetical protein